MDRNEFLTMREQLMENIDSICDAYVDNERERDLLVTMLCDMVCETMDPAGLS